MSPARFSTAAVDILLNTKRIGRTIRFYDSVGSTNDLFLRGEIKDAPPGSVAVADEQSRGRGRLGREWIAPPGKALLFSVLLRTGGEAEEASLLNMTAGIAVVVAVASLGGPSLSVRWPNDLYKDGRKVCGILSEFRPGEGSLVVGIGLNVNQTEDELIPGAASLRTLTGRVWRREPVLAAILNVLEEKAALLEKSGFEPIRREAEAHSDLVGRPVILDLGERTIRAFAAGIGPKGGLLLKEGKEVREYRTGEVTRVLSVEGF